MYMIIYMSKDRVGHGQVKGSEDSAIRKVRRVECPPFSVSLQCAHGHAERLAVLCLEGQLRLVRACFEHGERACHFAIGDARAPRFGEMCRHGSAMLSSFHRTPGLSSGGAEAGKANVQ